MAREAITSLSTSGYQVKHLVLSLAWQSVYRFVQLHRSHSSRTVRRFSRTKVNSVQFYNFTIDHCSSAIMPTVDHLLTISSLRRLLTISSLRHLLTISSLRNCSCCLL